MRHSSVDVSVPDREKRIVMIWNPILTTFGFMSISGHNYILTSRHHYPGFVTDWLDLLPSPHVPESYPTHLFFFVGLSYPALPGDIYPVT